MKPAGDFLLREWLVQPSLNRLSRAGESASLQPKFMDLLVHLAHAEGRVVSKEDILDAVWGREYVSEGTLTHAVAVIRQTLGDDVRNPVFIETIPTRGYRLVATVAPAGAVAAPAPPHPKARAVGGRRARGALALVSAVAAASAAVWLALRWWPVLRSGARPGGAARVVVMPFQNVGPAARDYVALGITDDITTRLASVHDVVVSSRTSAAYCAKEGRSTRQIAAELGVGFILEGSVRWERVDPASPSLRVNARLIRARDDTLLWGQSFTSDEAGAVETGAEIARQAVRELGVSVREVEQKRLTAMPTGDPDAYQAYLCGMRYHELGGREQLGLAISMFERAVKLDPEFALAYARLSVANSRLYGRGIDPSPERLSRAELAANTALRLRPSLPEAHLALGAIQHLVRRAFSEALSEYGVAARELPNDSELFALIADVHRRQGRWAEARREVGRVVELDPGNYTALLAFGDTLSRMRAYDEAERAFLRATGVAPDTVDPYLRRFWNFVQWDGGTGRAERILAEAPLRDDPNVIFCRSYARYLARDFRGAVEALARAPRDAQLGPFRLASRELLRCRYLGAAGDTAGAAEACAGVVAAVERAGGAPSGGAWDHLAVAQAWAVLGRGEEASRAVTAATAAGCSIPSDAYDGAACALVEAEVLARAGDAVQAIALVKRLLVVPSPASVAWLRVDPAWDPLRRDPGFAALVR